MSPDTMKSQSPANPTAIRAHTIQSCSWPHIIHLALKKSQSQAAVPFKAGALTVILKYANCQAFIFI